MVMGERKEGGQAFAPSSWPRGRTEERKRSLNLTVEAPVARQREASFLEPLGRATSRGGDEASRLGAWLAMSRSE